MQELYNTLVRKKIDPFRAKRVVRNYAETWLRVRTDARLVMAGISASQRWNIHVCDGQGFAGVRVVNPLN